MVCVAVGGIQAKRAAGCLQRREAGAGPSLRRQSRLPPQWVRKWSSVWDHSSAAAYAQNPVCRSSACWQGVNCEALTRSISLACTL